MFKALLARLSLSFILFFLCRSLFIVTNSQHLNFFSFSDYAFMYFSGARFDLSAIFALHIPFIVLSLLPFSFTKSAGYQRFLKTLFVFINGLALLLNLIDTAYFDFSRKRSTWQFISQTLSGGDLKFTALKMLLDFWYVPLFLLIGIAGLTMVYTYTGKNFKVPVTAKQFAIWALSTLALIPITITGIRGGWQLKPLRMIDAAESVNPTNVSAVLNTPFCLIKTFNRQSIRVPNYFVSQSAASMYCNPCKRYTQSDANSARRNIVIIVLESMGKEYIGYYNGGKGFTPFLDSLCSISTSYRYSYANGSRSMEGVPAVVASLPYLMDEAFITSEFNASQITSIASCLKKEGYSSAFFHGGNNGTMNFDSFCKLAGFDRYYGRNEYGQKDFDGSWGVYDEPFYEFFISRINQMSTPFVTTFFSLSSHHPYNIPSQFDGRFPKGNLAIHESIGYADYALRTFFEKASKEPWYRNTIFLVTADHTSISGNPAYQNTLSCYAIPVIIFDPQKPAENILDGPFQQIDIMPLLLYKTGFAGSFFSLGNDPLVSNIKNVTVQYADGIYQCADDSLFIQYNGEKIQGMFAYKTDTMLQHNLLNEKNKNPALLKRLQAIIQQHHYAMVHNKLTCDE